MLMPARVFLRICTEVRGYRAHEGVQVCDSHEKPLGRGIRHNRGAGAQLRAAHLSSLCQTGEAGHQATAQTGNRGSCGKKKKI